jgi:hypothetical protein
LSERATSTCRLVETIERSLGPFRFRGVSRAVRIIGTWGLTTDRRDHRRLTAREQIGRLGGSTGDEPIENQQQCHRANHTERTVKPRLGVVFDSMDDRSSGLD